MSSFKRINKSDVITVPYVANKQWDFSHLTIESSSIFIYTGKKVSGTFNPDVDEMTVNSQYQRLIYDSVNQQFYQDYSGSYLDTTSLLKSFNYESASIYQASASYDNPINIGYGSSSFPQNYGDEIAVISIPKEVYGDSISPSTFVLSSSAYYITDDGYGNLFDSNTLVGNVFYTYGVAVITNQSYVPYFSDTKTTTINWSNYNTPSNRYISSNLNIKVNGVDRVNSTSNQHGRFTVNVGDTLYIDAWSDGTWPSDGTSSLSLNANYAPSLYTTESGYHLTESIVIPSTSQVHISSYSSFVRNSYPASVYWTFNQYDEPGVAFLSGSMNIQSYGGGEVYLSRSVSGSGNFSLPAGSSLETKAIGFASSTTSSWGPTYDSASITASIYQDTTLIAYTSSIMLKNGTDPVIITVPGLTLQEALNYYVNVNIGNPTEAPLPATVYWTLSEFSTPGTFIDGNFKVQTPGGGIVYIDQAISSTGSFTIPAGTIIELRSVCFTNEAASSYWGSYLSASLSASLSYSGSTIASASAALSPNIGAVDIGAIPYIQLNAGGQYYVNVSTQPTLQPVSMSFSSNSASGSTYYLDNSGYFNNGYTGEWEMDYNGILNSGDVEPILLTTAPYGVSGKSFMAKSSVKGLSSIWGPYNFCNTVIDVYENGIKIASGSQVIDRATYPDTGSWEVFASASFTPIQGRSYNLNSYVTSLTSGSTPPAPPTGSDVLVNYYLTLEPGNTGSMGIYYATPSGSTFVLANTLDFDGASYSLPLLSGDSTYVVVTQTGRADISQRAQADTSVNSVIIEHAVSSAGSLPKSISSTPITAASGNIYRVDGLCGNQV